MKTMPAALLGLLLATASRGAAQSVTGLFRGTLGGQAIVLQLGGPDGSRYFYVRKGLDITLEVKKAGGDLALTERVPSWAQAADGQYGQITGHLRLTAGATGLSGTWSSPDGGRTLPVRLARVNAATEGLALPPSPGLLRRRAEEPYVFLKLNHALTPAPAKGGLNWWREPLSGLAYPRLPAGEPGNAALQDRQLEAAADALECRSDLGSKDQGTQAGWEQTTAVTYRSARLLSLRDDVTLYCGGAHPDAYTDGLTLDRRTGRALGVTDLWPRLSESEQHRRYLAAYPQGRGDDCRAVLQDFSSSPSYAAFLTARGLTLWPAYLPHAVLTCAEEVTLTYASVAPLAGPLAPRR